MQALRYKNFTVVEPFLSALNYHTVLKTLLDGSTPGYVYVDDPVSPKIVFTQFRHRAFITGDLSANEKVDFERFFTEIVFENCRNADVTLVRLTANPVAWLNLIESCFKTLQPIFFDYQIYKNQISNSDSKPQLPEGFNLRQVDKDLVGETFDGKEELLEEMCSERDSVKSFLDNSFGIVAFHGKTLAGWCLSEYNHKNRCELGIATLPPFQKRGLAKAMTFEFLNLASIKGLDMVLWHCYKSNHPSRCTALSAGFELIEEHKVMNIYLEPSVNLAVHGNVAFEKENYHEAISWYQQALNESSPDAWMAWNAACAAAHLHKSDLVFEYLDLSIDLGFSELEHIEQSKHFVSLHEDSRWRGLIERLKTTKTQ